MKYLPLFLVGLAIWFATSQFLARSGPSWDLSAVVAKLKELGSRIHYTVGVLAVILLAYFLARALILAARTYF